MVIKKGDFVQIRFTGKLMETGEVFDTTNAEVAKQHNIYDKNGSYGEQIVCIGEGYLLPGLDKKIIGKEPGKSYKIMLSQEEGFGKKDGKLLKLISTSKFKKQGVTPFPGLRVDVDGIPGVVRIVTGGRTIVDFNHPLAGRDLVYEVQIGQLVTDTKEKLQALLKLELLEKSPEIEIDSNKAKVKLSKQIPTEILENVKKKVLKLIPEIAELDLS